MSVTSRDVVARTWNENILFSALVELTYRCNLDCFFCYNDLGLKGEALRREQYVDLFEDLASLGTMHLALTGGEPLAHPDFLFLGAEARRLGFVVRIKSNGHALRGRIAERIRAEIDPFMIEVSLHGATAETHDRQTRVPGSFARLLENLPQVKACGLRVKLNGTLTAWNEHELEAMFELSERIGIPLALTATVTPRDDGDLSPLDIAPSRAGVERMYRFLSARAASAAPAAGVGASSGTCAPAMQTDKNCGAGSSAIAVDPFGNVYPCVQWRRRIGSLHESRLMEIWQRSSALAEVRAITVEAKRIKDGLGPAGRRISFCPGISEEKTGNPLAVDQAALDQALVYHEVDQALAVASLPVVY